MTASPTVASSPQAPDFADLYAVHLPAVWRFVRSRVPDHHEAYDVTSEVFTRAWRSWDRFDPARGPVEPWLFTIASRAVVDWWRRRRDVPTDELPTVAAGTTPEDDLLRQELLGRLASALEGLEPTQRDALALRFAARLSMAHLAQVLGTTEGAAKMLVHRTLRQLREQGLETLESRSVVADLEELVDGVVARGHADLDDGQLRGMLLAMAVVHDQPVPDDLPTHVATCVQCAAEEEVGAGSDRGASGPRDRGRFANGLAAITAFMGVCLVCTVPALQTLTLALGVGIAGYVLHLTAVVGAPLVAWLVWRGVRRHGRDRAFRLARAGAVVMAAHAVLHLAFELLHDVTVAAWLETTGTVAFVATDWVATALLVAGALLNLRETQRWRRTQASGLRASLVAPAPRTP